MVRQIGQFSSRLPWLVILVTLVISGFMLYQIQTKLRIEPDLTKFLPNSMPTTKANDYYKKNFNYQDSLLIGIESNNGPIMTAGSMRIIEKIVDDIKALKVNKIFKSKLSGKEESIEFKLGIDTADIMSIVTLDDAVLDHDTGSVATGSVIKKLKRELGIKTTDANEERLPKSDADLNRIIPKLKEHITLDRTFSKALLSKDLTGTIVQVPMVRKWDYKRQYATRELMIALNPEKLKKRYQGEESTFPHTIYEKTIGIETYDDAYIQSYSKLISSELRDHLRNTAEPVYDDFPQLKTLLDGDMNVETFEQVLTFFDQRDFNLHPEMVKWENFSTELYEFMLENVDPMSRENLEFQLYNVRDIYDLNLLYEEASKIIDKHSDKNLKFYIGGAPVITALFSHMIAKDMGILMPIAIGVIFLVLLISFRSVRGVIIPLVTVIISMIWALGSMAITGTPVTVMTSILPIVLLAVGSAYGIHLLNRYYEDVKDLKDRQKIVSLTVEHVGVAVLMAGITTFVGFLSLTTSELSMIQHFGLFSALGVAYALLLTITFSPALLVYWPLPRHIKRLHANDETQLKLSPLDTFLAKKAYLVATHPKFVLSIFVIIIFASISVIPQLEIEGGQMSNFNEDSPVKKSDHYINEKLTGTAPINLLFKFREKLNLDNVWAQQSLKDRSKHFTTQWNRFSNKNNLVGSPIDEYINAYSLRIAKNEFNNAQNNIEFIQNILNEEFSVDEPEPKDGNTNEIAELNTTELDNDLGGLDDLADTTSEIQIESLTGALADLSSEQVAGLKLLNSQLTNKSGAWKKTAKQIVSIRNALSSKDGLVLQYKFNELSDLFEVNVKQPHVLQRVEKLQQYAEAMESPTVTIYGKEMSPTGLVTSPIDLIRKFYMVFYHDENRAYDRLPNTKTDPIADKTLTDRGVIGVVLNQAQSGSRDNFDAMISPDLKEFQLSIMGRSDSSIFVKKYSTRLIEEAQKIFPDNGPYIEKVTIAGYAPSITELMTLISTSQIKSIGLAFVFVFMITFFIFRSALGGFYSILPLVLTVTANFATMWLLGWKINTGTMLVASISIGIGVDYTIHFLERYKIQLRNGDDLVNAYINTVSTSGKAIIINALSVSFGFLVLMASDFVSNIAMGILMAGTMLYSALGALMMLPALIIIFRPKFFQKHMANNQVKN